MRKVKMEFEKRLDTMQQELNKVNAAKKEHAKMMKNQVVYDRRIRDLSTELNEMKKIKVGLLTDTKAVLVNPTKREITAIFIPVLVNPTQRDITTIFIYVLLNPTQRDITTIFISVLVREKFEWEIIVWRMSFLGSS